MRLPRDYKMAETRWGAVRYSVIGPEDGEAVLYSTGGGASFLSVHAFSWLADAGFRVIAINRPGYYDLDVGVTGSIAEHADIYHSVLESIGVERPHVFGVSMGGLSALHYASRYPIRSLVLWSAVTGPYVVNSDSAESGLGRMVLSDSGKGIISFLLWMSVRVFPRATVRELLKTEADLAPAELRSIAAQVVGDRDQRRQLRLLVDSLTPMASLYTGMMDEVEKAVAQPEQDWSSIRAPVLAVHSSVDIDVPIQHAERIEATVQGATLMRVRSGGHFVWWGDEGNDVRDATLSFLNRSTLPDHG